MALRLVGYTIRCTLSFFRVAPADLRPGTRPAHPGPAHRRTSAVAFQVPGELLGGELATAARGRRIVSPLVYGHLRAAISIASQTRTGAACCRPNRITDCFLGAAAGDGRQTDRVPLHGCGYRWMSPTHFIPGLLAAGVALDQVGARAQVRGRRRWRRVLSAWLCGHQALLTHGRARTASRSTTRAPAAAGPR